MVIGLLFRKYHQTPFVTFQLGPTFANRDCQKDEQTEVKHDLLSSAEVTSLQEQNSFACLFGVRRPCIECLRHVTAP